MSEQPADRHVRKRRPVGVDDEDWDDFGELVGERNRSEVLRRYVRGLLGRPGAKIPRRRDFESKQPKND